MGHVQECYMHVLMYQRHFNQFFCKYKHTTRLFLVIKLAYWNMFWSMHTINYNFMYALYIFYLIRILYYNLDYEGCVMFVGWHSENFTCTHYLRTCGRGSSRAKRERKEEVNLDYGLMSCWQMDNLCYSSVFDLNWIEGIGLSVVVSREFHISNNLCQLLRP